MKTYGPYSPAVIAGDFIFCSGQIGIDPKTKEMAGGIQKQTVQTLENLRSVLQQVNSSFEQVVKCDVYLKNMDDFEVMNEIYGKYLNSAARVTIEVSGLPKEGLIEISCVAHKK